MELLMTPRILLVSIVSMFLISGCTTPKRISRDYNPAQVEWSYTQGSLNGNPAVPGDFDGVLQPVYERKLRGSVDGALVISSDVLTIKTTRSRVLVYNRAKGNRLAQIKKSGGIAADPLVYDSLLLIYRLREGGQLELINLFSGKTEARRQVTDIRAGPILIDNTVIYGGIGGIRAFTVPDLQAAWADSLPGVVNNTPVFDNGVIYYATDQGAIRALSYPERKILWTREVSSAVTAQLTVGTYLYAETADGSLMALDLSSGQSVWAFPGMYPSRGGAAEQNGIICFGTGSGTVYGLGVTTGLIEWEFTTDGIVTATPLIVGSVVVIGSHDRTLYTLNLNDGSLIDKKRLEGAITATAAAVDGEIFAACRKERLYCFKGAK
jgi:outer membrane protein assembly factor BamB